jgi:hypothetical protein
VITLLRYRFNIEECEQQLDEFKQFLDRNLEISESGEDGLQKFFAARPSLILLIGYWSYGLTPAFYKPELNLFNNEFRADFVISDRLKKKFMFIV